MDAVRNSRGAIDGLFLDATPKVAAGQCGTAGATGQRLWGEMVDQIRGALGPDVLIIDNGFYLAGPGTSRQKELAGTDAWVHSGSTYTESVASIGTSVRGEPAVDHLRWIAEAAAANPTLRMIGHGGIDPTPPSPRGNRTMGAGFEFGLAKFLLTTASTENGWFLANEGYGIDQGLLSQPMWVYGGAPGSIAKECGEPTESFVRSGPANYILTRKFAHGRVSVDVMQGTGKIECTGAPLL